VEFPLGPNFRLYVNYDMVNVTRFYEMYTYFVYKKKDNEI